MRYPTPFTSVLSLRVAFERIAFYYSSVATVQYVGYPILLQSVALQQRHAIPYWPRIGPVGEHTNCSAL